VSRPPVNGLDIVAADARDEKDRPHGYAVCVLQRAFTLWNMQQDADVTISSDLVGVSAGRDGAPVRDSGIFVGGGGDRAGRLTVRWLETDAIYRGRSAPPHQTKSPAVLSRRACRHCVVQ
jgi:hypothetical protein